jgi:ATP-dependent RNA helicase SUPV3L1/SUV3
MVLNTEIDKENKVLIDNQYIGELKGLKFNIDFTSNNLDVDLKSIKKAARKGIESELKKRVDLIISQKELSIGLENKIIWKNNPIGKIKKGDNYLNPVIEVIADDALQENIRSNLEIFLDNWLSSHIDEVLKDLIGLTKLKIENQYLRALSFQLYENNGIIKRKEINHIIKLIDKEERKKLWNMGIKIGRYHVYLPKMLKPKAVVLRTNLWKLYNNILPNTQIPTFGLNFVLNENFDARFLLICGFEKFKNFFVRVDILEKLFISIIEKTQNKKFKINSEMINLLGCTKENFYKLMELMNYKKTNEIDTYFFGGEAINKKKKLNTRKPINNPFEKLLSLNIK